MSRQPKLFEPEVPIPEELSESVALWRAYKLEQFRQKYKPLGLAKLVEEMVAMGPERAMQAVKFSMAQLYQGLIEKKNGGQSWDELKQARIVRELRAPGVRVEAPAFVIAHRLAALVSSIPSLPEGLDSIALRVSDLTGEPADVEAALAVLDGEMLEIARANIFDEAEIEGAVEKTLALLRGRLPAAELVEQHRSRIFLQVLRRVACLPTLSLFSREAQP